MTDESTGFFTREALYGASPVQALGRFFVKYFNFRGRASMSEFWWVFGFLVLSSVAIGIIVGTLAWILRLLPRRYL